MLLRLLMEGRLPAEPPLEGVSLKLVEFAQKDGDKIAVNPDHVASVEERGATKTRIKMQDGSDHTVEVGFADVIELLQE